MHAAVMQSTEDDCCGMQVKVLALYCVTKCMAEE